MPVEQGVAPAAQATARVFFALWPDAALRESLHWASGLLHQAHGGRRMNLDTVHLTLLFVGSLERARLPELQAAAAGIQMPKFEIAFDQADCWRHNRIAFLTASQPPAGLFDLVRALEAQLGQTGIGFDRRPYKPHITLVRNADCKKENVVSVQANVGKAEVKRSGRNPNTVSVQANVGEAEVKRSGRNQNTVSVQANPGEAEIKRSGRNPKPALKPILWAARDFVLVESNSNANGASYKELARWCLL